VRPGPLRIAHRGMPRAFIENTVPSFRAAISARADGIELDVHATSDGVVIVHHDEVVPGVGEIARTPWNALRDHELAPGIGIPTLEEVCQLVDERTELFVEIKGAGIEQPVLDVLRGHRGRVAIHSFDHALIRRIAASGSSYRLGLLLEGDVSAAAELMRAQGAIDLWPEQSIVTEALIRDVQGMGGRVIAWTVNDGSVARRLAALGIDGLCTDDVRLLDAR